MSLTNFKAFRRAEVPLAAVTLLTGLNSSGKSSVLQAMALLRQSHESGTLLSSDGGDSDVRGGLLLNDDLVELGSGRDACHEDFLLEPASTVPVISIGLSDADGTTRLWEATYDPANPDQDVLPLVRTPDASISMDVQPFGRRFQYLKADRIVPATTYPRSHRQAVGRGFLGARGEHAVNYLRHHALDLVPPGPLRHPEASGHLLLDQVVAWMRELCPGVRLWAEDLPGTDTVRLSFGFGSSGDIGSSSRRRPTNVGFGLTYALPIVVACLTATPSSLILLENPEAHLHPRGQSRMAALIAAAAAAGAQLIVETHSDHVLDGTRLAVKQGRLKADQVAIHFFRGDGASAQLVSPVIGSDGMLSEWPEGFFDEADHTLDQLLG